MTEAPYATGELLQHQTRVINAIQALLECPSVDIDSNFYYSFTVSRLTNYLHQTDYCCIRSKATKVQDRNTGGAGDYDP